jgi:hypothetical protein
VASWIVLGTLGAAAAYVSYLAGYDAGAMQASAAAALRRHREVVEGRV